MIFIISCSNSCLRGPGFGWTRGLVDLTLDGPDFGWTRGLVDPTVWVPISEVAERDLLVACGLVDPTLDGPVEHSKKLNERIIER